MPEEPGRKLKHLLLRGTAKTERYTSPKIGRQSISNPSRNPLAHGENLLKQISKAQEEAFVRDETRVAVGIADQNGMYLEFQSEPEFELALKSLESTSQGIELTSVRQRGEVMLATVYIPEGKLVYFTKKLEAYGRKERGCYRTAGSERQSGAGGLAPAGGIRVIWNENRTRISRNQSHKKPPKDRFKPISRGLSV